MAKELATMRIEPDAWKDIKERAKELRLSIGDYITVLRDFAEMGDIYQGQYSFKQIFDLQVAAMRQKLVFEHIKKQIRLKDLSPEDRAELLAELEKELSKE